MARFEDLSVNRDAFGLSYDRWLSAEARQLFRSLDAGDHESARLCLFRLEDEVVFLLGSHLEVDNNWLALRSQPELKYYDTMIDFLTDAKVWVFAPDFIRIS